MMSTPSQDTRDSPPHPPASPSLCSLLSSLTVRLLGQPQTATFSLPLERPSRDLLSELGMAIAVRVKSLSAGASQSCVRRGEVADAVEVAQPGQSDEAEMTLQSVAVPNAPLRLVGRPCPCQGSLSLS